MGRRGPRTEGRLTYAVVTPARDEAANLERLAACITSQTILPERWEIVDNGSRDATVEVAGGLARVHPWVELATVPGDDVPRPGAPVVRAFMAGVERIPSDIDVVAKLDADVSIDGDYFERILAAFAVDDTLGIAGGACFEWSDGSWREIFVTANHVRGASRCYRRECLADVWPLEERVGWDGIDELRAEVLGWRTRLLRDTPFRHHRAVGERDGGATLRWRRQGRGAHYMGYRFSYLVLRSLYHARRRPAALAMVEGYIGAAARREPQFPDSAVRRALREQQRLRKIAARWRERRGSALTPPRPR